MVQGLPSSAAGWSTRAFEGGNTLAPLHNYTIDLGRPELQPKSMHNPNNVHRIATHNGEPDEGKTAFWIKGKCAYILHITNLFSNRNKMKSQTNANIDWRWILDESKHVDYR